MELPETMTAGPAPRCTPASPLLLALLLALGGGSGVACGSTAAAQADGSAPAVVAPVLTPGEHVLELEHGGRPRRALVRVPPPAPARDPGSDEADPPPVLLAFHGGGGHAEQFKEQVRLEALADEQRFVLVFPDGSGPLPRRLHTWNAGTCCGSAAEDGVDDVGFVRALVDRLAAATPIDRGRIYATGFSNGGMLSWRLAAEAPDLVAAVAPVGGGLVTEIATAGPPVPVLHIHSVDDPRALHGGGLGPPFPLTNRRQQHPDMAAVLAAWAARDGLAPEPVEVEVRERAGHTATRLEWRPRQDAAGGDGPTGDPPAGAVLVHWRLTGAGHVWPGAASTGRERLSGPATEVIDANREIWAFVSHFRR